MTNPKAARLARSPALLLIPVAVLFAFVFVFPMLRLLGISLGLPETPGIEYYVSMAQDSYFIRALVRTLKIGLIVTLGSLICGYPVAYMLVRSQSRLRHLVFVAVLTPLLVSIVVRSFSWIVILGDSGVVNRALVASGIVNSPLHLLYNDYAVSVALIQLFIPFMVLSIVGSLSSIDARVEESAGLLGARPSTVFRKVTFPMSIPGVAAGCALVFSLAIGSYVTPALVGGGKVETVTTLIYDYMLIRLDWERGSAMAWILLFVVASLLVCYFSIIRRYSKWRG